jgi:uncharacterized protein YdeI (YjbR/CyaY-like superfamily)
MTGSERVVLDVGSPAQCEQWLEVNHDSVSEVWLRPFNKSTGDVPVSYGEAVEIALCFGWIDSLAHEHDEVSGIQFSPRRWASARSTLPNSTAGGRPSGSAGSRWATCRASA